MHICFDWDATLVKREVAEEASIRRGKTIGTDMDRNWIREAMKTHAHYDVNREAISKYTGITDKSMLTILMTDIFRFHYVAIVHEMKEDVLYEGIHTLLDSLRKQGHRLSIASTLRQDILDYSLENLHMREHFDSVKANTPDLQYTKEDIVKQVVDVAGEIDWMIGDREDDMQAGMNVRAKTIFVKWGAGVLNDIKLASFIVEKPEDILDIIENNNSA